MSLLVGNLFYSWQAMKLARRERRSDVCALPYGINTPSLFAFIFLVMLPVKVATGDSRLAWQVGLVACLGSGLIELAGACGADWIRKNVPRAALLTPIPQPKPHAMMISTGDQPSCSIASRIACGQPGKTIETKMGGTMIVANTTERNEALLTV